MEMDLTKFDSVVHREMSASHNAKQVKCVKINKKNLILKKFSSYDKYLHEKKIYNILEDEDFVPKLVYFDNKNFQSFHDSEDGCTPRKKIRIRNYKRKN